MDEILSGQVAGREGLDRAASLVSPGPASSPVRLNGKRLLVIEERPFRCRIMSNSYRSWGFSVAMAGSLEDVIRILDTEPVFDFCIYDRLHMGASGLFLESHCCFCGDLNQMKLISMSGSSRALSGEFFGMLGFAFLDFWESQPIA